MSNEVLRSALARVRSLADELGDGLREAVGGAETEEDIRAAEELFEEELDRLLRERETFHTIIDDLLDEIEKRFELFGEGEVRRTRQGWPLYWTWTTDSREQFIKSVLRFSSNQAALFGRLLTPLVNGIRVAGSFQPAWASEKPALVLLDGEGLGHTPDSTSSLSTSVMRRLDDVDAVLLVDSAMQPMQAAPVAAMRALVSSGNVAKLLLCFTHFDAVHGDNLRSNSERQQHVIASVENVLTSIGQDLGPFAERALRRRLEIGRFFVADIDKQLKRESKRGRRTIDQLLGLLAAIDNVVERPQPVESRPLYDRYNLVLAVKKAAENFHESWLPRLGLAYAPGISKEHWTRVKALTRRLATGWTDEYDTLRPVADLEKQLRERMLVLAQNPREWTGAEPDEDEKQEVFSQFMHELTQEARALADRRVWRERMAEWQAAYGLSGTGSTFVRAHTVAEQVYDRAAPIPDDTPSPDRNQFLHEVIEAVDRAASAAKVLLK